MSSITHSQFIGCIVCGSCKGVRLSSPGSKNDVSFCSPQLRSVLTLVSYRTKMIDTTEQGWVQKLVGFMDKFYRYGLEEDITCILASKPSLSLPHPSSFLPPLPRREVRTAVRIEALNFLVRVLAENSLLYEVS